LGRRSPSVCPDTQDNSQLSDTAAAACQSDEDLAVITSLLEHVIRERKDLGTGFRRLLMYFIIYFWFLELKGVAMNQTRDPIFEIGNGRHCASISSWDILAYLDQFVHPLQGLTARLQNGNFFTPGRTVVRRLKAHWESMGTQLHDLNDDDQSKWRALSYVYGTELPPRRTSDKAKDLGPHTHRLVYTVDWQNLMKSLSSPGLVLPVS
jgi:hypothetical protein